MGLFKETPAAEDVLETARTLVEKMVEAIERLKTDKGETNQP